MIYWVVAIACGYAIGTFMPVSWKQYAACVPVSALLYFLVNLVHIVPSDESDIPPEVLFVSGTLMQSLVLMLGVYFARRKAKRNSFKA